MGLDISYYTKLVPAADPVRDEWGDFDRDIYFAVGDDETRRAADLKPGVYTFDKREGFRAGSYGGYNQWRDMLAVFAAFPSARYVWNSRDRVAGQPFVELIDFSDFEGVIGPTVSAKLAADFAAHQERANAHPDEWWRSKYAEWRKAFEVAADGGAVEFW
jgi:hypothetical protein